MGINYYGLKETTIIQMENEELKKRLRIVNLVKLHLLPLLEEESADKIKQGINNCIRLIEENKSKNHER